MANNDYPSTKPCTILATTKLGFRIETANAIREVPRHDVVPTPYGWGLIVRGEKTAESRKEAA